jgi:hypothetical protein
MTKMAVKGKDLELDAKDKERTVAFVNKSDFQWKEFPEKLTFGDKFDKFPFVSMMNDQHVSKVVRLVGLPDNLKKSTGKDAVLVDSRGFRNLVCYYACSIDSDEVVKFLKDLK